MSGLFSIAFLLSLAAVVVGIIIGIFFKGRRRKGWATVAGALVASVLFAFGFTAMSDKEARDAGFLSMSDQQAAKRSGATDASQWEDMREAFLASEAEERRERRDAAAAEKEATRKLTEDEICRANLVCWGDKQVVWSGFRCPPEIEKLASYRANWLDGWLEPKFSHYRWLSKERGTLTMIGDQIEFENGFGAAINMIYECDIDPAAEEVLAVRVYEGRL